MGTRTIPLRKFLKVDSVKCHFLTSLLGEYISGQVYKGSTLFLLNIQNNPCYLDLFQTSVACESARPFTSNSQMLHPVSNLKGSLCPKSCGFVASELSQSKK